MKPETLSLPGQRETHHHHKEVLRTGSREELLLCGLWVCPDCSSLCEPAQLLKGVCPGQRETPHSFIYRGQKGFQFLLRVLVLNVPSCFAFNALFFYRKNE